MINRITIPDPCQESWDEMLPESQGKHCLVCQKTVIDFTDWEPGAISAYLKEKAGQKLCGRFKASQLEAPADAVTTDWVARIEQSGMSFIKKIAAVVIIVFGLTASSCDGDNAAVGEPRPTPDVADSSPRIMGVPLAEPDDAVNKKGQIIYKDTAAKKSCPSKMVIDDTITDDIKVGELVILPKDSLLH